MRWCWVIALLVSFALRIWRYASNPSFWGDEMFLLTNILQYDLTRLLTGPLTAYQDTYGGPPQSQSAPPLFLAWLHWLRLTPPLNEYTVRLLPFVASLLSVVFTALVARRFSPQWGLLAVLFLGLNREAIFQSANLKPYSIDLAAAAFLIWLATSNTAWLTAKSKPIITGLAASAFLLLSFAMVIVGPVAVLIAAWKPDTRRLSKLSATLGLAFLFTAILLTKFFVVDVQRDEYLTTFWQNAFPNLSRPWLIPVWWIETTAEIIFSIGPGFFLSVFVIAWALVARSARVHLDGRLVAACLGMLLLNMLAGTVHAYPYITSRVCLYLVVPLSLLTAHALEAVWHSTPPLAPTPNLSARLLKFAAPAALIVVALIIGIRSAAFVASYKSVDGRFRQTMQYALHTLPPGSQLVAPDAGTTGLAVLYAYDTTGQLITQFQLDRLDPRRPVSLIRNRGGVEKRRPKIDPILSHPAFASRPLLTEEHLPSAAILHLGPVTETPN